MITVKRLDSGHYHVRGDGPCNWAQPPFWPCDEETLRAHAFPEASETFIRDALKRAQRDEERLDEAWTDLGAELRRMGEEEPGR